MRQNTLRNDGCGRVLKDKGEGHLVTGHEIPEAEWGYSCTLSLTSALDGGWVINATPRPFYPREGEPVPLIQKARWAPEAVWTAAENLPPTGIRSPERATLTDSAVSPQLLYGRRGNIAELHGRT